MARESTRIEGDEYLSKLFKEFAEFQKWRELEAGTRTPQASSSPRLRQQGPLFNSEEADQHFKFGADKEQVYPNERGQTGMRTMGHSTMPIPQESVQGMLPYPFGANMSVM